MQFTVVQGDIAAQSADAFVNAAGTSLRMGSGVAGFDTREGARLVLEEVRAFDVAETLDDVRVIAYSDDAFETVRAVSESLKRSEQ